MNAKIDSIQNAIKLLNSIEVEQGEKVEVDLKIKIVSERPTSSSFVNDEEERKMVANPRATYQGVQGV